MRFVLAWVGLLVVVGVAVFAYASRTRLVAEPLCVAESVPEEVRLVGADWVWLERTAHDAAVVVVRGGRRSVLARHDRVVSMWSSPSLIVWAARDGDVWTVRSAGLDGSNLAVIAECSGPPFAVWTDGARAAWIADVPVKTKTAADFIPSLGRHAELWQSRGGKVSRVAVLSEALASAQIVGYREGAYVVACVRDEGIRCSALYAVGTVIPPIRFAGEVGTIRAMMSSNAWIYWTAPSRGSNSLLTGCIRAADMSSLKPETIADWLPAGGQVTETKRGILVIGAGSETAWRIEQDRHIGVPVPMLPDQWPVGAGGDLLLTVRRANAPGRVAVNTVRIP